MDERTSVIETTFDLDLLDNGGAVAFPRLTAAQIDRISSIAAERRLRDGDALWRVGDRAASFYIVLDGAVAITQPLLDGSERMIVKHGPGGFTGDIDLLSSKSAVVAGTASGESLLLEVCPQTLQRLVVTNPDISDVILAAFIDRRRLLVHQRHGDITLIGSRYSPELYVLREFLERNSRPFNWYDVDDDPGAQQLADSFNLQLDELPAVVTASGDVCRNPTVAGLARELGLSDIGNDEVYDMAVVGGGPAGLAAAVYGGSEGLRTIVLEAHAPGGQAATSSKIENYLGFPMGVSGAELARNALVQAEKFGVRFATPRRVAQLTEAGCVYRLDLDDGEHLLARTVVAACGVRYRRLPAINAERFEGRGIYFAATRMEADLCAAERVAIVGGGNSAGQAAVFLSQFASEVHILIRAADLTHSMSRYLINRIESLPNVFLHPHSEISQFNGDQRISAIEVSDRRSGSTATLSVSHVFVFIGAVANTDWLAKRVALDRNGFVHTGETAANGESDDEIATLDFKPSAFETCLRGVFAVGDVRCGSTKRVASAVGEGSVVVQFVHQRIAEHGAAALVGASS